MRASFLSENSLNQVSGAVMPREQGNVLKPPFCAFDSVFLSKSYLPLTDVAKMVWQLTGEWAYIVADRADQEKKRKAFKQRFDGYMKLYLDADTVDELLSKTVFTGKWATKRRKLMGKPRLYKVNLYMFSTNGDKEHDQIRMLEAGSKEDLWQVIVDYAQQVINDNPHVEFDRERCNAVVRA